MSILKRRWLALALGTAMSAAPVLAMAKGDCGAMSKAEQPKPSMAAADGKAAKPVPSSDKAAHPMKTDVVDAAMKAGQFTTLTKALQAAGLVNTLKDAKTITVFAPTDAAFQKLPPGQLDELMKPENKQKLVDLLEYHVVTTQEKAKQLKDNESLNTLEGKPLTVHVGADVMVNDATVEQPDIEASNGVIHAIDKVLMPE